MAKYWVPLLSILYKDEEALWGKLTTGTLFFLSGGSPSQPESRLGSGDSKSANSSTLHCSTKSSPTTDLRHTTSSWNANTEVLGRQQKVKSLTRLLLRLLLFFWSHREWPFPPAFFSHQIQVDQGKTFRVLYDFSRALISSFASPVMIPLAPDFGGVSSIIRLRSGPKESPERQCLATAELKTKILCPETACSQSQSPGIKPDRSLPSQPDSWGLWPGGCW